MFYEFSLGRHIPADHLLRSIDRFIELGELRQELAAFYSTRGRPSIDPELMIRMLIVGLLLWHLVLTTFRVTSAPIHTIIPEFPN